MRILTKDTINKVGEVVTLKGWVATRRDHGKLIFIDLRDRWGMVQVVFTPHLLRTDQETREAQSTKSAGFSPARKEVLEKANQLRSEWVVEVRGMIKVRPKNMENPALPTGSIEIEAEDLNILNESKTPPFALDTDGYEIGEENRLHYRYLDLRRERLKNDLFVRDKVIAYMRDFLHKNDFIEIETPILTKSTPEGARDYVVPSRVYPGKFYALPQSPQQYKQLLMVSGLERYFQIARCFRDEDTRGDRQPEFTQLDIEMSFTDREEILAMTENLYLSLVRALFPNKKLTLAADGRIPVMTYKEVMERYGTDKPDVRKDKNDKDELAFLFVVDFPAFEWKETERRWDATHHPFTKPRVENVEMFWKEFKERPGEMLADQYDFVLNGYEIGGGSIRIHDPELLKAVFEALGNTPEEVERQFGHMLEAFRYGVPPHGGIAPGIDRFVMILQNEPNIREVIAFPKTGDGRDLMMDAPAEIGEKQLKELNIRVVK